jgi:hypothetical protein
MSFTTCIAPDRYGAHHFLADSIEFGSHKNVISKQDILANCVYNWYNKSHSQNAAAITLLLNAKADPNTAYPNGSLLHLAAMQAKNGPKVVEAILAANGDPTKQIYSRVDHIETTKRRYRLLCWLGISRLL